MSPFERKELMDLIMDQATAYAIENGSELKRSPEDRQGWAGVVQGLRRAAAIVDEFQKDKEEDFHE